MKSIKLSFLATVLMLVFASCVSQGSVPEAAAPVVEAPAAPAIPLIPYTFPTQPVSAWKLPAQTGSFALANLPTLESRTLSNGVVVIVKKNPANRVFSLKVAYKGGVAMTTPEQAGIEAMTLALMARGSERYSYMDIQRIQYEKSSSVGYTSQGYDWSSFDLATIDKYWDDMFEVFADCLLKPAFLSSQFNLVQNDFKVSIQKSNSDPYNVAVAKLHEKMFAGHPYQADYAGSVATVSSMTLEQVKAYYDKCLQADRMAIIAVGNFDTDKLVAKLEATIGKMPRTGVVVPKIERYQPKAELYLERFDKSKGIAYVRGDYPLADVTSPDFATLQLGFSILNELLFSVVRTDHGACYSTWSNAHGFLNPYGSLVVYKTDKPEAVKGWVDECIALLASGKTLNLKGGGQKYAPIADSIEAYKAKYVNAF
ncbi:MAG TPA: pitrilysin family protein, partial [Spirochaetales bacterium]|nr:pitrilysin family protein [Spirochaetales bacterium]